VENDASPAATALGTGRVNIAGLLVLTGALANTSTIDSTLWSYVGSGGALDASVTSAKPSDFNTIAVPAGKPLFTSIGAAAEGQATVTVPARVQLTTTDDLNTVSSLTVTGTLTASSAEGLNTGIAIIVNEGGSATVGTIAKLDDSTVANKGRLTATSATFKTPGTSKIVVSADGTVNSIAFPASTNIKVFGASNAITIDSITLTGGVLALPATAVLTVTGTLALNGTSSLKLADAATSKLALTAATGTDGAKLTGTGKVVAGKTEISGNTGGWQAVHASSAIGSVAIAGSTNGATITGGTDITLTVDAGVSITQNAGLSS
jgi:hypothetical protein